MPPILGEALEDPDDDDYVAQILTREARDNSLKFSTQGMGAYMSKRPTSGAPKPNTRFLRNIIRNTDSHNMTLRKKEEREAKDRMRQFQARPSSPSQSSRRHGDYHHYHSDRGDSKRKKREEREDRHDRSRRRRRHRSRSGSAEYDLGRGRRQKSRPDDDIGDDRSHRSSRRDRRRDTDERYRSRHERSYSGSRSRSPRGEHGHRSRKHRQRHGHSSHRSASPPRKRHRSHTYYDEDNMDRHDHRSSREQRHHKGRRNEDRIPSHSTDLQDNLLEDESDPLEDLIGPIPPNINGLDDATLRSRGRGAYRTNTNNIDGHFAPDYNPTLDVHAEDDDDVNAVNRPTRRPVPGLMAGDDDWDLALEALRDRARWRQKGEQRLREAGFNESVVERWKNDAAFTAGAGAGAGDAEEVTWSKKGEGREWDRGKVVGADGHVDVKAPW